MKIWLFCLSGMFLVSIIVSTSMFCFYNIFSIKNLFFEIEVYSLYGFNLCMSLTYLTILCNIQSFLPNKDAIKSLEDEKIIEKFKILKRYMFLTFIMTFIMACLGFLFYKKYFMKRIHDVNIVEMVVYYGLDIGKDLI